MQYFSYSLVALFLFISGGMAVAEGSVNGKQKGQYPAEFKQGISARMSADFNRTRIGRTRSKEPV